MDVDVLALVLLDVLEILHDTVVAIIYVIILHLCVLQ